MKTRLILTVAMIAFELFSVQAQADVLQFQSVTISRKGSASKFVADSVECAKTNEYQPPAYISRKTKYAKGPFVGMGFYGSIRRDEPKISTIALATCSAVFIDAKHSYLAHNWIGMQDLAQTTRTIDARIKKANESATRATFLLSYSDVYAANADFKELRDNEYTAALCDVHAQFPNAKITVVKSVKKDAESDDFSVSRQPNGKLLYHVERWNRLKAYQTFDFIL